MADPTARVNPLLAGPPRAPVTSTTRASRRASRKTAKLGGYAGVALTAWLVTAVATGSGLAQADADGTSSDSSSASSSADSKSRMSNGESSTARDSASSSAKQTGPDSRPNGTRSAATEKASTGEGDKPTLKKKRSSSVSPKNEVAPHVASSSSDEKHSSETPSGATTAQDPTGTETSEGTAESESSAVQDSTSTEPPSDTNSVGPEPESSTPADEGESFEPSQHDTPTTVPAELPATVPAKNKSKSAPSTATVDAAMTPPSSISDSPTMAKPVGDTDVAATTTQPAAMTTEPSPADTTQTPTEPTVNPAFAAQPVAATPAAVAPTAQTAATATGLVSIVSTVLRPFIAPDPARPAAPSPIMWTVLAWVQRKLFNQSPTIEYNPETAVQTGQTVYGNIGATDPEGDALTYTVTGATKVGASTWVTDQGGTLTIDQTTGDFAYTPADIDYYAPQTDAFSVSVTDGKKINLLGLFKPRTDEQAIGVTVLNPTVDRVIISEADLGIVDYPWTPRFSADGNSIYFTGTPTDGDRSELWIVNVDGTGLTNLTAGLSPDLTQDMFKPVPTYDGTGRVLVQVNTGSAASAVIYEPVGYLGNTTARLVPIIPPPSDPAAGMPGGYLFGVSPLQEPRISPDGQHILFNRLGAGQNFYFGVVPVVGELDRTTNATTGEVEYVIVDPRVIAAAGESKNWTPDGKGIICLCGLNEQGNADNVIIDLATGEVTRLNGNLDYDEDMDLSPNQQWMAVGSLRSFDGLTPVTRIVRPVTLPLYVQGPVYYQYAIPLNISNQEWLVAVEDDLKRENGIPLFVQGDGLPGEPNGDDWTARSMPGWNVDGTAVVFWEYDLNNPNEDARLVIAKLKYTTSVGTIDDRTTPDLSDSFPELSTYVLGPPTLPAVGTYPGAGGGSYTITEEGDSAHPGYTLRTVTYDNYDNGEGLILEGYESTSSQANLHTVYYKADIQVADAVTGENRGYLKGDATIDTLGQTSGGRPTVIPNMVDENGVPRSVTSSLDGDVLHLLDQERYELTLAEQ